MIGIGAVGVDKASVVTHVRDGQCIMCKNSSWTSSSGNASAKHVLLETFVNQCEPYAS